MRQNKENSNTVSFSALPEPIGVEKQPSGFISAALALSSLSSLLSYGTEPENSLTNRLVGNCSAVEDNPYSVPFFPALS